MRDGVELIDWVMAFLAAVGLVSIVLYVAMAWFHFSWGGA